MAYCAPQQLSQCLPKIVPKLTEVLTDTHPKVQSAGQTALQQVGNVIKNPEIAALVPTLLMGLTDPNEYTKYSLDILLQTMFINTIDAPSLALLVPIVHRGLRERGAETKKKASQIAGNMCSLVTEPKDMIPYIGLLLPEVKKVLVDPIPEVRAVAARAIGSLIRGMGEDNFPDLVPWLLETLKSDASNVERSGAAQGLSEVRTFYEFLYHLSLLLEFCISEVRTFYEFLYHLSHGRAIIEVLGKDKRNEVLAALYMVRTDVSLVVRQVAGRSLGELVRKLGDRVLPLIIPILSEGLTDPNPSRRQGVCIGLSEVMASAGKSQLLNFMDELIQQSGLSLGSPSQLLFSIYWLPDYG